jgi:hypothetical protein
MHLHTRDTNPAFSIAHVKQAVSLFMASNILLR